MARFDKAYPEGNKPDHKQDGRTGFGDDGGTRVGSPDAGSTGAGSEATRGTDGGVDGHDREHVSRYGGKGGKAKS